MTPFELFVRLPAAVDYFGLDLAFDRLHFQTLGQPFAVDFRLDSSYFAWTAFGVRPFGQALGAVAAAAENAVVDSSLVAYCLVHFRQVHLNSDCFAKMFDMVIALHSVFYAFHLFSFKNKNN